MKKLKSKLSVLFLFGSIISASSVAALPEFIKAQKATSSFGSALILNVSDFEALSGQVLVALFETKSGYDADQTVRSKAVPVNKESITIKFERLPVGEYAYKLFHDVNGDGKLNTDVLGIPKEPYYFSQDVSDPFSAPEWEEAKFLLPAGTMKQSVEIN